MRLLCHEPTCEGHDQRAGTNPYGCCRFCRRPLADSYGVLLIEPEIDRVTTDMIAVTICAQFGHVWEGHLPPGVEELRGFCSRCGLRISLPR